MIKVLLGPKGTGKTKQIIDMVNKHAKEAKGNLIFIDDDKRYMFEIDRPTRFIDASEYYLGNPETLLGFIGGLTASDYDLEAIYLDGFLRILDCDDINELEEFFAKLDQVTSGISLIISIRGEVASAPDFVQPYLV